jgi:hypothetical protein
MCWGLVGKGENEMITKHWAEEIGQAVDEIDNKSFEAQPVTIVITTDVDDTGRYFDATIFKGLLPISGLSLVEYIGAESLSELLQKLNEGWT